MKFSTDFVCATHEFTTFKNHVPAPMFRKEFSVEDIKSAEITICGLGFYELFVNGKRITRGLLSPYISNPDQILYYDNYDVTPYLNNGKNVIGIMLGNGMLNCPGGYVWDFQDVRYRSAPKFAMFFEAMCGDEKITFDARDGFKCAPSPIIFDDLRAGEFYDARLEVPGWNTVGFDDSGWKNTMLSETPHGEACLCNVDPIVKREELAPISIKPGKISEHYKEIQAIPPELTAEELMSYTELSSNDEGYIYDFGTNAAGICRINIKNARPGQKLVLQFAEKLSDDGGLDLRGMFYLPVAYDHRAIYICKGGDETWEQMFTYFGYRYVLISGIDENQATKDLLTYVVMNTRLEENAHFNCSDEVVNKIWRATLNADYANFYHFPTDCPHREKNGWTADAALSTEQTLMSLTPERNYREWMRSIRKTMLEDGSIPGIIPTGGWGYKWGNGPAWDTVLVTIPYFTWLYRGDKEILRENATAIFRYINYITTRRDNRGLIAIGLGDWCHIARSVRYVAPLVFTDTVICIDICTKAAKIFEVLGMDAQSEFASRVADEFRTAARKYLIDKNTLTAMGRCQATQAMAIFYDIFDNSEKHAAFEKLVEIIENDGEFINCGVLGARVIFHVLSAFGRTDLAYKMIVRPEYPSYGYMMRHYDSTLWERVLPDEAEPSSRNHHFFGDVISWFMKNLVGINVNPRAENPNEILFAPKFIDALDNAEGSYNTSCGKVSAEWHRDGEDILYTVSVPSGVCAEFALESGWKTEEGNTWLPVNGKATYRLIRENKPDIRRLTSSR